MLDENSSAQPELDWSEEPIAPHTHLTLGQLIDGFRQLSDEDKDIFMMIAGRGRTAQPTVGYTAPQPRVVVPPVQVVPAVGLGTSVVGTTRDPKTGKVFNKVAPATRASGFLAVENNSLRAKQALAAFLKRNGLVFNRETGQTVSVSTGETFIPTQEYNVLVNDVKTANAHVKQYKTAHPEEFRPPPVKGKGRALPSMAGLTPPGFFQTAAPRSTTSNVGGTTAQVAGPSGTKMPIPQQSGARGGATEEKDA